MSHLSTDIRPKCKLIKLQLDNISEYKTVSVLDYAHSHNLRYAIKFHRYAWRDCKRNMSKDDADSLVSLSSVSVVSFMTTHLDEIWISPLKNPFTLSYTTIIIIEHKFHNSNARHSGEELKKKLSIE